MIKFCSILIALGCLLLSIEADAAKSPDLKGTKWQHAEVHLGNDSQIKNAETLEWLKRQPHMKKIYDPKMAHAVLKLFQDGVKKPLQTIRIDNKRPKDLEAILGKKIGVTKGHEIDTSKNKKKKDH